MTCLAILQMRPASRWSRRRQRGSHEACPPWLCPHTQAPRALCGGQYCVCVRTRAVAHVRSAEGFAPPAVMAAGAQQGHTIAVEKSERCWGHGGAPTPGDLPMKQLRTRHPVQLEFYTKITSLHTNRVFHILSAVPTPHPRGHFWLSSEVVEGLLACGG